MWGFVGRIVDPAVQVKVRLPTLTVDERRIGLVMGHRGGRATKAECLAYLNRIIKEGLDRLPETAQRHVDLAHVDEPVVPQPPKTPKPKKLHYYDVDADAVCRTCGEPKYKHGQTMGTCRTVDAKFEHAGGIPLSFVPRPPKAKE